MAAGENPYEAPRADLTRVSGVRSGLRKDLRDVAVAQKGILVCILLQIALFVARLAAPANLQLAASVGLGLAGLVGTVFVFLLAIKVYHVGLGVVFGILALFPCVGLLVLLMINSKATNVLQANGIKVGLLGADMNAFPRG